MANTIGLTDAAAALKEHFGPRLDANHDEGIQLMADVLQERFGVSRKESRQVVVALERAHTIRWVEHGVASPRPSTGAVHPITPTAGEIITENPGGTTEAALPFGSAYWQF